MKTESPKQWAWVRGGLVVLIFALIVAFSQREIQRLKGELEVEKTKTHLKESLIDERDLLVAEKNVEIAKMKLDAKKRDAFIEDVGVKIEQLDRQNKELQKDYIKIMGMAVATKNAALTLKATYEAASVPNAPETSALPSGMKRGSNSDALEVFAVRPGASRAEADPAIVEPEIPEWYPPLKDEVAKQIKDAANALSNDYNMINYEIQRQTEAYSGLVRYHKTGSPFIRKLISKYALRWGSNYAMIVYEVSSQIDAREKLEKP
jgi:hypothetical protein